jgi:DMSO/TMAO reductase YedYZ molybdopterin-dependent catalytic subunit
MKRMWILSAAALGVLTGVAIVALNYLGLRWLKLPFIPFDSFDWLTRILPGVLITTVIHTMVSLIRGLNLGSTDTTAKLIEQSIAIGQFIIGGGVLGVALAYALRMRPDRRSLISLVGGGLVALISILVEAALGMPPVGWLVTVLWIAALSLAWNYILTWLVMGAGRAHAEAAEIGVVDRRQFLYVLGATLGVGLGSLALASISGKPAPTSTGSATPRNIGGGETSGPAASPPEATLEARIPAAPGTRPELTSNADFYRIDINTLPPALDGSAWEMKFDGLVVQPTTYTIQDLVNRPSMSQVVTMQCISNPVGGDLTSTARWTGVPLKTLLAEIGLRDGASAIQMEAADGFYESISIEEAMDERVLLVYAMGGVPLPVEHGFPLRIYIPGHYGMKQPKWITHMEAIDNAGRGYWVERGWSQTAIPKTTSVIDTVAVDQPDPGTGKVPVGGIAWAGERGISRVELSVDDGPWNEVQLRLPPLSPLSWVQWRSGWDPSPGTHQFQVRAYDGNGDLQVTNPGDPYPDGATGIDTMRVRV